MPDVPMIQPRPVRTLPAYVEVNPDGSKNMCRTGARCLLLPGFRIQ